MIAPADYLDTAETRILSTVLTSNAAVDDELLPWADPYIAQLFQRHAAEVAATQVRRSRFVRPHVAPAPRRELVAVA